MPKRFEELIAQGEGISIEFKECKDALPKNVFETLCAFLNRFGGDIFLGLKDDGTINLHYSFKINTAVTFAHKSFHCVVRHSNIFF